MPAANVTGMVGITGSILARYGSFYDSLLQLDCPNGTLVRTARSANVAENRNLLTQEALDVGAQWLLYLDDDQVIAPDTLKQLLKHDKDVVSGLYLQREPPFTPHCFDREDDQGRVLVRLLQRGDAGLVPLLAVGAGCLLVQRRVLEALTPPYWTLGQIAKAAWGDDIDFCRRVRAAGFGVYCDLDTLVGHSFVAAAWPVKNPNGEWMTALIQKQALAMLPAAHRPGGIIRPDGIVVPP